MVTLNFTIYRCQLKSQPQNWQFCGFLLFPSASPAKCHGNAQT